MKKDELAKLQGYLRKTLGAPNLDVRAQPKKDDMAEVFVGEEFIGPLYRIVEDGETEYQLNIAILVEDLEGV
ncbi:MAG: DUF3126 family protein [Hyphomicrobium sp.]